MNFVDHYLGRRKQDSIIEIAATASDMLHQLTNVTQAENLSQQHLYS